MARKVKIYFASKDNKKLNFLGENGWYVFSEAPLIIAHDFTMVDGEHLNDFKRWLEERANFDKTERDFIEKAGFKTKKVKSDGFGGTRYVIVDYAPLFNWRVEFDYNEDRPMVYITFGPKRMASPAIASKEAMDKYVPEEILAPALENESIYEAEVETETEGSSDA